MELKSCQIHVMDDIGAYLDALDTSKGLHAAWKKYWDAKGVAVNPRDESYVIYADICTLSAAELEKYRITFKKIPRDITRF